MVFWNQKKKRTTAKPKTTASISKPKVGSVKQELNLPVLYRIQWINSTMKNGKNDI